MAKPDDKPGVSPSGWPPQGSEWDWYQDEYPIGISLMLVRGVTPERVIEAYGANPAEARVLPATRALETLTSWVRVGRAGEWTFAFDDSHIGLEDFEQRIARELSAGTDLVLFESNPNITYFWYYADGTEVTSFEPLLSTWRGGSDPDRFLPQMRQAGLNVEPPPDDDDSEPERNPAIALLDMLTLALGIRLSGEVALGPLLTVRPGLAAPG
ncbi:MAG TPA: DUF6461 domain-containing protein [Streptosporangiaceae bacterium]|jgi:hypothetical protein|nr:DUF6461 domain-containing protein [Streptosporangiaceae bacterium]